MCMCFCLQCTIEENLVSSNLLDCEIGYHDKEGPRRPTWLLHVWALPPSLRSAAGIYGLSNPTSLTRGRAGERKQNKIIELYI